MANITPDEQGKVSRILEFFGTMFPGSAAIPETRVVEALRSNGGSQERATEELAEELQRASWESVPSKEKKKADRSQATGSFSAPTSAPLGRGRGGGRGRGTGREGGYRDGKDDGHFMDKNNRGGMARGRGGRGGRAGPVRGAPQDTPASTTPAAPIQVADTQVKPAAPQQPAPAPAPPAATASVPRDAPPPVQNQWSKGRPRTEEELPKPPPEKPVVKQQAPGPAWNGTQSKTVASQPQSVAAPEPPSQTSIKPVVPSTTIPPAAAAAPQHVAPVPQQQASTADRTQTTIKPAAPPAAAAVPAQASTSQYDQNVTMQMSQLGLADTNGQMQAIHKSPQKPSIPEPAVNTTSTAALQQEVISHDYNSTFTAPTPSNTQPYTAQTQVPSNSSGLHFQYQPQATMTGTGQAHADELYNDPSKMGQMGGYNQLESFGGMGTETAKSYGGGHQPYNSKGYSGGKGANVGGPQQAAGGQMPMGWQQQQQQNMLNPTWANPYMGYNMQNMQGFNMAMYMQQAGYGMPHYPMQGFQGMQGAQAGLGGSTNSGGGGGGAGGKNFQPKTESGVDAIQKQGGAGSGGGVGGGYQGGVNYAASSYTGYGGADPNATNASQDKYGGNAGAYQQQYYMNAFPAGFDNTMAFNQQNSQGFSNMRSTGASNSSAMNTGMGMDPNVMGYPATNYNAGYSAGFPQGGWGETSS